MIVWHSVIAAALIFLAMVLVLVGVLLLAKSRLVEFHCTLAASRRCLDIPSHQLHLSAAACGYDMENHHHALCDAEACAAIALKLL